ncbi:MAG: extracellular solute-binding protein, partial [Actinobacteria bacterium]|nr:extracellular solute-binding protein [Actinomycetota bacterium]
LRYEGYTVWVNALVESAGGTILKNPGAPPSEYKLGLDEKPGTEAAAVIAEVAHEGVGGPSLSTSDEEVSRALFEGKDGGFLVNWPYVWPTWLGEVEDKTLDQSVVDDIGWTFYPRVDANTPSAPPVGGIGLGIGAFTQYPQEALDAAKCITSPENQAFYFVDNGSPAVLKSVYKDKEVLKTYPMAAALARSLNEAAPRPQTPYYNDVSASIQRDFHPPASVDPQKTPDETAQLILGVISGEDLL